MALATLRRLQGLATEKVWELRGQRAAAVPATWPLSAADLARVELRWPVEYEWERTADWMNTLLPSWQRKVRVTFAPIPQPYPGGAVVEFVVDGTAHEVFIDVSDYPDVDLERAARFPLYFKMQYARGGYGAPHVVPGGYVTMRPPLYTFLGPVRALTARPPRHAVYGRFGLEFAAGVRRQAVGMLREQTRFPFTGGLAAVRYSQFLAEVARSRVCIDLPGNGPFCFRLVDYLAVGACVVAVRHTTELHVPLVDGEHLAYVRDDLADLVDVCAHYLEDEAARRRLAGNARDFFDRYLHADQLASYYLTHVLRRLG